MSYLKHDHLVRILINPLKPPVQNPPRLEHGLPLSLYAHIDVPHSSNSLNLKHNTNKLNYNHQDELQAHKLYQVKL